MYVYIYPAHPSDCSMEPLDDCGTVWHEQKKLPAPVEHIESLKTILWLLLQTIKFWNGLFFGNR